MDFIIPSLQLKVLDAGLLQAVQQHTLSVVQSKKQSSLNLNIHYIFMSTKWPKVFACLMLMFAQIPYLVQRKGTR